MPNINSLIQDIYKIVGTDDGWFNEPIARGFADELGLKLIQNLKPRNSVPTLRLSAMGNCCPRSLWASIHAPTSAEILPAWVRIKFTYGHILEALVIAMAKAAGHEVTGEQDELVVDGILGHRDCVIDGCLVDVKSTNSRSYQKIKDGLVLEDEFLRDYLDQLDGYLVGSLDDPLVRVKDRAYILAIDKVLGHMCLYEHRLRRENDGSPGIVKRIREYKEIVGRDTPPPCTCKTVKDGESGNFKLDTKASYNPYKHFCFPTLRTFLYSNGPRHLTKVARMPKDVGEIDKFGKYVYN